jgi:MFS family permease
MSEKEVAGMERGSAGEGWQSLLRWEWIPTLAILLGGVLVQSTNVLMLATVMPSIVGELGGVAMLSWPTTAYLASSIVAASCAGMLANTAGARIVYCAGVTTFGLGALLCLLAASMGWIVAGRLIQGFGDGLEAAVIYVLVRETFPPPVWPRAIALMSTGWSVSVLIGPLVGGTFAQYGSWRTAFVASAVAAGVLATGAFFILPPAAGRKPASRVPAGRVALICLAIAGTSLASAVASPFAKAGLILAAMVSLAAMLRLNRTAPAPLLPRDAFSWRTQTGAGLWLALLLCITFSPLQLYMPMFLQQLHGLDPLAAGFSVAAASLAWTAASLATASASGPWPDRLMLTGPAVMGLSLAMIALLTPHAATLFLIPAIALLGAGIGQCWPFVAPRVMDGAKAGDEAVAASSVATVQQAGYALGAAIAGLVANANGLSAALADEGMARAAFWVPASFVVPAILAVLTGLRLRRLRET